MNPSEVILYANDVSSFNPGLPTPRGPLPKISREEREGSEGNSAIHQRSGGYSVNSLRQRRCIIQPSVADSGRLRWVNGSQYSHQP